MQYKDIDSKIDWKKFYGKYFEKMKPAGKNKMLVKCPFHHDEHPSMWFNTQNGCWKCEACGESGNAYTFLLKKEGMSTKDAYVTLLKLAGEYTPKENFSVDTYSSLKKLPLKFLSGLGVKNCGKGIEIPYFNEAGKVICTRRRYAGKKLVWNRGDRVNLYGLQFIKRIRKTGYVVLVEGESDSETLWLHSISALGVPGASTFRAEWVKYIDGLKVYVYVEPELSGKTMLRHTCSGLLQGKFKGEAYKISIDGFKDPSALHVDSPEKFEQRWKGVMGSAEKLNIESESKYCETFPGAPVQLKAPHGWRFSDSGIDMLDEKKMEWVNICKTPVLLSRRMKSLDTGEERIEVAFKRDNAWQKAVVQRSVLFQSRTVTQLSDIGITVTSENARLLVKYLGDLEAENIDLLKTSSCVSQLGWYGNNFIPGAEGNIVVDVDRASQRWVDAYKSRGTLDEWKDKMQPFRKNSIFRFIMAGAFAAPLLKILNGRIFIIHNWGESRNGKTAALKAALSVWGNPDELMTNFNATKVGIERLAGFFSDLPIGIDEKQVAGSRQDFIESLVYMLSVGTAKIRGAKSGGLQSCKSWRCIALTTGEEPLTTDSSDTGVYTRTLEIYGSPFESEDNARDMHDISSSVFGCAGVNFIKRLTAEIESNPRFVRDIQQKFQNALIKKYPDKMGSHVINVSIVAAADSIASKWIFGEDDADKNAMDMAVCILGDLDDEEQSDATGRTYEFIREWTMANANQFKSEVKYERYGYYDRIEKAYYIFPHVLKAALEDEGFSYRKTLKTLGDRGLVGISYDGDKKKYSVVKFFEGRNGRFIKFVFSELKESAPF